MKRTEFVIAYRPKAYPQSSNALCLACKIYRGRTTHGKCPEFSCTDEWFNNTKHTIVTTMKWCDMQDCIVSIDDCVMKLKFSIPCWRKQ